MPFALLLLPSLPPDQDSDSEEIKPSGGGGGKTFGPMPGFGRSLFGGDDDLNLAGKRKWSAIQTAGAAASVHAHGMP